MSQTETLCVNLFAGPGSGKSTMAAHVFALLKYAGINCELVREYYKELAWEGRHMPQAVVFGEQMRRELTVCNKVDVYITDSPLELSYIYGGDEKYLTLIRDFRLANNIKLLDVYVNREKEFNPAGRYQTEMEAKDIDHYIQGYLQNFELSYKSLSGNGSSARKLAKEILKCLNKVN